MKFMRWALQGWLQCNHVGLHALVTHAGSRTLALGWRLLISLIKTCLIKGAVGFKSYNLSVICFKFRSRPSANSEWNVLKEYRFCLTAHLPLCVTILIRDRARLISDQSGCLFPDWVEAPISIFIHDNYRCRKEFLKVNFGISQPGLHFQIILGDYLDYCGRQFLKLVQYWARTVQP